MKQENKFTNEELNEALEALFDFNDLAKLNEINNLHNYNIEEINKDTLATVFLAYNLLNYADTKAEKELITAALLKNTTLNKNEINNIFNANKEQLQKIVNSAVHILSLLDEFENLEEYNKEYIKEYFDNDINEAKLQYAKNINKAIDNLYNAVININNIEKKEINKNKDKNLDINF